MTGSGPTVDVERPPLGEVRWGQAPLSFELVSEDRQSLHRAHVVFRPWMREASDAPRRRWSIERAASGGWWVRDPRSADPVEHPTVDVAVRAVEYLATGELFESPEATTLHAALVARGQRGVAIVGSPETGKSTLATVLWRRGWTLLGDDLLVVDPASARAWTAPRRVALRNSSRDLVGDLVWRRILETPACDATPDKCLFHPDEVEPGPRPDDVRLAALVFLGRRDATPPPGRARPLPSAQALLAVLPHSNLIRRADAGAVIQHFLPLLTTIPAYDLGRGPLDAMAATMESLFTGPGP